MSRATTRGGGGVLGPKSVLAFALGVGLGLGLVAPVLPDTLGAALAEVVEAGGAVVLVGVAALAVLMVLLALLYRTFLRA